GEGGEGRTEGGGGEGGGGEACACLERVQVVRAERAFPVGEHPLVLGDGVLGLAARQVGGVQPEAGGQGGGMLRTLDALPVGQRVPVRADRLGDPARGQGRGGVLFPCRQRVDVVLAADEFAACHLLIQDCGGVLWPARLHPGP